MDAVGETRKVAPVRSEAAGRPGVLVFPDPEAVAREATRRFVQSSRRWISETGRFHAVLAGGRTPQALYQLLGGEEFRSEVNWSKVHLFWGDERVVPPEDPESNYGMVHRELLTRVPIPVGNIHRMEAECADLGRAAQAYEEVLRHYLRLDARGFPRFHLILLGMGRDGHTASLFPESGALEGTSHWVATPFIERLGRRRMTLTLPVLNAAYEVIFLVTGAGKAESLRRVLEAAGGPPLPAQLVQPIAGKRLFLVDAAAAALLGKSAG
jgi:6-phosphogluconolactonase